MTGVGCGVREMFSGKSDRLAMLGKERRREEKKRRREEEKKRRREEEKRRIKK